MSQILVLLVEDSEEDAHLALRVLHQQGFTKESVLWVQDGEEALAFLTNQEENSRRLENLKLILMDLKMPKLSGLEVLARIRQCHSISSLPVVIWSSSAEHKDIEASYNLGSNSYVVKPMSYQDFSETISGLSQYWLKFNRTPDLP